MDIPTFDNPSLERTFTRALKIEIETGIELTDSELARLWEQELERVTRVPWNFRSEQ
jgi:hypothetical protein